MPGSFETTTDEVLEGVDLTGKTILVTGASAGLGVETTRALAAHGASVVMAARDLDKAKAAIDEMFDEPPPGDLELRQLDLASLASVEAFAMAFCDDHDRLDVLIANAGVMACPFGRTADGFELQFGTNHLGHFLLANLLVDPLSAAAPSRVVVLSSAGHRFSDVDLDDPNFEHTPYDKWISYGRSKTANVLFAVGFDRRYRSRGIRAFALHPGGIFTELGRHLSRDDVEELQSRRPADEPMKWKTVPQGAATSVYAATSPELDGQGGLYLEDCHIADPAPEPDSSFGVRPYALDPERADALWALSERLVGRTFSS